MTKQVKIALVMAASLFMEIMDGTIVTTALPAIAKSFHIASSQSSLLVSVYLITVAVFIPLSGWLGKRFGQKQVWLVAVSIFSLSSLANAFAPSFTWLLIARVVQGISGSMMTPTARLIVLARTAPKELLRMTSYFVWPALIAPAIAPIIGGWLVTNWSWHWIFLINVPIGVVIMVLALRLLPNDWKMRAPHFDVLGFLLIGSASALLLLGGDLAASRMFVLAILAEIGAVCLLVWSVSHLRRTAAPLFSLSSMRITSFRVTQTGGFFLWLAVGAMPYMLTVFLQTGFGWSAVQAGAYVLFIFLGNIGIKPFTTSIITRMRYKGALLLAFALVLLSALAFVAVTPTSPAALIMFLAFVSGVGRSLALTAYNALSFAEIPLAERGDANTLNAVVQTLAQGLGVSLITVVVVLLHMNLSLIASYHIGFVFLAALTVYPLIETALTDRKLGAGTL
ncbi:MAG TPA: MFS transporter [Ruminococcaceae bacterium]|nr:MFS transporter [Oscillospiraceae bacterium]